MLSTSAFNALLKTLENRTCEFIFATTKIRKVPVTVLSRCQRFDLKRIEPEVMIALLLNRQCRGRADQRRRAGADHPGGGRLGPGRDLDPRPQAISHGAGETTVDQVRAMLGLAAAAGCWTCSTW